MFDKFNKFPETIRRISKGMDSTFDLFPGVSKPSVTLCYMLVAQMLKQLDVNVRFDYNDITATFDKFVVKFRYDYNKPKESLKDLKFWSMDFSVSELHGKPLGTIIGDEEKLILVEGFKKFYSLYDTAQKMKSSHNAQQLAVDIIDKLFNHKREGDENVHSTDGKAAS